MQIDRINGLVGSIAVKVPCQAATTANITLSGTQTVDGVALISNDRCLVKNQTNASENGIYDVSGTEWSRSLDFNGTRDIDQGTCVRIISGTVSGQYFYEVTTSSPLIGTTDIDFALVNFPTTTSPYIATLLDDADAAEARTTLGVLHQKVIDIGDWDMNASQSVSVSHGLTLAKIRGISAVVRDDSDSFYYDFMRINSTETSQHHMAANSITIDLFRGNGGGFDGVGFDATSFNRGWITIQYTD